jgi:hypothetical protein
VPLLVLRVPAIQHSHAKRLADHRSLTANMLQQANGIG